MENYIILAVLAVIIIFAVRALVKKSRSKGGCCGGGDYVVKSRKLKSVIAKRTFQVEGMSCQHCVNRVTEAVQDIPHTSAAVDLKKGTVTVSMEEPVDDAAIKAAIERQGCQVTDIK